MRKFEIILVMVIMAVFLVIYFYLYKSISKNAVITVLLLGMLSLLSFSVSESDLENYTNKYSYLQ
ncbi:hypothetical protein [Clostridium sp. DJ247]|uniref:hypothetical protein n=1 Tax=Clostridium sp. DJ247 TaxID=2726188 RepID=UPI0016296BDB|nr:hypothetical protein [Clostridium sp. DJ247]MBC2582696.1 hypothetical protein [Clostridium sp. DJ247]